MVVCCPLIRMGIVCCTLIKMGVVLVRISVNSFYPNFIALEKKESSVNRINYSGQLLSCIQTSCDRDTMIIESPLTHFIDHST